jgi:glycosyltransferase EpsE
MTSSPTVSFIMGVYRCKNTEDLFASVKSVISQTFRDWEFLIVDDGSADNGITWTAIEAAAALDSRIIPLRYDRNQGLAYALDYCLERTRGRFIARQDDDDLSRPTRLEKEIEYLEAHPSVSIVGTSASTFDEKGVWGTLKCVEDPSPESFLWNSPFIHPSVVMRAEDLRSVGGYRVAPETQLYEDYDLFMRMYSSGMRGHNIPETLYDYRSNRNTSKPRLMSARLREAKIRAQGFKALGLGPKRYLYIAKPIILGLVPRGFYGYIQGRRTAS